ncbi:unnamed protein product [Amoebophrya sp. A25]|nr:unnamed protein product [Amoebophrya sp. A25]|eukprot:GSA25T00019542001.1
MQTSLQQQELPTSHAPSPQKNQAGGVVHQVVVERQSAVVNIEPSTTTRNAVAAGASPSRCLSTATSRRSSGAGAAILVGPFASSASACSTLVGGATSGISLSPPSARNQAKKKVVNHASPGRRSPTLNTKQEQLHQDFVPLSERGSGTSRGTSRTVFQPASARSSPSRPGLLPPGDEEGGLASSSLFYSTSTAAFSKSPIPKKHGQGSGVDEEVANPTEEGSLPTQTGGGGATQLMVRQKSALEKPEDLKNVVDKIEALVSRLQLKSSPTMKSSGASPMLTRDTVTKPSFEAQAGRNAGRTKITASPGSFEDQVATRIPVPVAAPSPVTTAVFAQEAVDCSAGALKSPRVLDSKLVEPSRRDYHHPRRTSSRFSLGKRREDEVPAPEDVGAGGRSSVEQQDYNSSREEPGRALLGQHEHHGEEEQLLLEDQSYDQPSFSILGKSTAGSTTSRHQQLLSEDIVRTARDEMRCDVDLATLMGRPKTPGESSVLEKPLTFLTPNQNGLDLENICRDAALLKTPMGSRTTPEDSKAFVDAKLEESAQRLKVPSRAVSCPRLRSPAEMWANAEKRARAAVISEAKERIRMREELFARFQPPPGVHVEVVPSACTTTIVPTSRQASPMLQKDASSCTSCRGGSPALSRIAASSSCGTSSRPLLTRQLLSSGTKHHQFSQNSLAPSASPPQRLRGSNSTSNSTVRLPPSPAPMVLVESQFTTTAAATQTPARAVSTHRCSKPTRVEPMKKLKVKVWQPERSPTTSAASSPQSPKGAASSARKILPSPSILSTSPKLPNRGGGPLDAFSMPTGAAAPPVVPTASSISSNLDVHVVPPPPRTANALLEYTKAPGGSISGSYPSSTEPPIVVFATGTGGDVHISAAADGIISGTRSAPAASEMIRGEGGALGENRTTGLHGDQQMLGTSSNSLLGGGAHTSEGEGASKKRKPQTLPRSRFAPSPFSPPRRR